VKALLKEQGKDNPTTAQLKKALDKIEDEHHVILFLYKADKTRYGKYVKQLENNMLEKVKDPFPKTVADTCQILAGWHNVYGHNPKHTETNDRVAFATTGNTNEAEKKNKKVKKKNITCFKCKKNGHYSNECPDDEEKSKNGSSFLVLNTHDTSDDESANDDTDLTISHDNIAAVQGGDS